MNDHKSTYYIADNSNRTWGPGILFKPYERLGGTQRGVFATRNDAEKTLIDGIAAKDKSVQVISTQEFINCGGELPEWSKPQTPKPAPVQASNLHLSDKPGVVTEGVVKVEEVAAAAPLKDIHDVLAQASAVEDGTMTEAIPPAPKRRKNSEGPRTVSLT